MVDALGLARRSRLEYDDFQALREELVTKICRRRKLPGPHRKKDACHLADRKVVTRTAKRKNGGHKELSRTNSGYYLNERTRRALLGESTASRAPQMCMHFDPHSINLRSLLLLCHWLGARFPPCPSLMAASTGLTSLSCLTGGHCCLRLCSQRR